MKKAIVLTVFFFVSVLCYAADPVEGYWLSIDDNTGKVSGGWQIYQEGGKVYGKLLSFTSGTADTLAVRCKEKYDGFPVPGKVNAMPVVGTTWIFGLKPEKPGNWTGGNIINPEDGKMYKCKLIFRPADGKKFKFDTLEMRGEIGFGIGRSVYWEKTNFETASSLFPD
jgi:uncharacterized protein (DUF2147 family)